jgi:hypothetical protein
MKKFIKLVALSCLLIVMTGCMKMKIGVDIIDEDTVETTMTMLMEESYANLGGGEDPFKDSLSEFEDMDADIKEIEEEYDGDTYVGYEITVYDEAYNQNFIDNYLYFDEEDGKEVYSLIMPLDDMYDQMDMGGYESSMGSYSPKDLEDMGIEMTMSFTFPYDISEASAGEVDGDTVTINIFELMDEEIDEVEVTAEESGSGLGSTLLYVAIAIVVIAGGAVAFIVIRNKKNNNVIPEDMDNEPYSNNSPLTENTEEPIVNDEPLVTPTEEPVVENNNEPITNDEPLVTSTEEPVVNDEPLVTPKEDNIQPIVSNEPLVPTQEDTTDVADEQTSADEPTSTDDSEEQ